MHHRPSSFLVVACAAHAARAAVPVPPALLINLPKHTERFKTVTAVFDSANIRYERAEAVDGRALSDEELKANVTFMARHFCTPGMITRAAQLHKENPDPTEEEVRFGMAGNLCRCTGYQNIVKSVLAAAATINAAKEAAE